MLPRVDARIDTIAIPNFPQPPALTSAVIDEITGIVFETDQPPQPCDLIFIFGGSHPGLWIHGAEAYHAGLGQRLITTGGHKPAAVRHHSWQHGTRAEAEVMLDELVARGVPQEHVFVEDRSTNSLENVLFAQQVYDFSRVTSILAVCKSYGVGRQCRTLRHHIDPRISVRPYPFATNVGHDGPDVIRDNWMTRADSRAVIFGNVLKIIKYGRKGHIEPLTDVSDDLLAVVNQWLDTMLV